MGRMLFCTSVVILTQMSRNVFTKTTTHVIVFDGSTISIARHVMKKYSIILFLLFSLPLYTTQSTSYHRTQSLMSQQKRTIFRLINSLCKSSHLTQYQQHSSKALEQRRKTTKAIVLTCIALSPLCYFIFQDFFQNYFSTQDNASCHNHN